MDQDAFYIRSRGKVSGPFAFAYLQKLARRGALLPFDELSRDRSSWATADRYPNLFPGINPSVAPAAPTMMAEVSFPAEQAAVGRGQPAPFPQHAAPSAPSFAPPSPVTRPPTRPAPPPSAVGQQAGAPAMVTVGRDASVCQIVVDSLAVSRRHLALHRSGSVVTATDLGSSAGTFINGVRLTAPRQLSPGDSVSLGGVLMEFDGTTLTRRAAHTGYEISMEGLGRQVTDQSSGKPRMLIRDVTMTLRPGEFIALVGASGAGKSTLFGAISGRVRGTHGQVLYDGEDLYANFEAFRATIGYVPQRDVFHDVLTVTNALWTTSRLRLSKDTSNAEIAANIDRVLKIVSLTEKRDTVISRMSGGEQKRVAIAMELLSRPRVLFLDEPTAPLDPRTTLQMMALFRELADSGITVIMITHAANSLSYCDVVAYMHKGLLTFQGTPDQIKQFFEVTDMGDAYTEEEKRSPDEWRKKFDASSSCQAWVAARIARRGPSHGGQAGTSQNRSGGALSELWHQTRILTARYARVITADRVNLTILLLLAPFVTALLCLVASSLKTDDKNVADWSENFLKKQGTLCFGSVLIAMFLAIFASVREIAKELPIYLHEHFVNVEIIPYLISKFVVLLSLNAVQSAMVAAVIIFYGKIEAGEYSVLYGILFTCSAVGTALGLMISSLVTQSDQAVTGMIVIVIPEIIFSGALLPIKGLSKYLAAPLITAYWGRNALMSQVEGPLPETYTKPGPATLVMVGQFVAIIGITYWLMVRKDGPGASERIAAKLRKAVVGGKGKSQSARR